MQLDNNIYGKRTGLLSILLALCFSVFFIQVHAQVKASFTVSPTAGCSPLYVATTNASTGTGTLTYKWNFGFNTGVNSVLKDPSTTYPTCGNYTITLVVSNGTNTDTARHSVTVYCNPIVGLKYNITSGCPGTCVTFIDTSKAGSGTIVSRVWDFGDGSILDSNVTTVTHCYSTSGTYSVSLQVTNSFGCVITRKFTNIINIFQKPIAAFTPSFMSACSSPFTITFTNTSANYSGGTSGLKYSWDFGDPGSGSSDTSSATNPSHSFSTGSYNITLVVTDANGCKDTLYKKNEISIGSTKLSISPLTDSGCCPLHVNFTSSSTLVPTSYSWNFGGAAPNDTNPNPNIVVPCPTANTTYNVQLTASYAGGCTVTANATINVRPRPHASFKIVGDSSTCSPPTTISFVNTSTPSTGNSYLWTVQGNTYGATTPGSFIYTSCGGNNVQLIAKGQNGCVDTVTRQNAVVIVCTNVNFRIKPKTVCVGSYVSFVADSFPAFKGKYIWDFGDGSKLTSTSNHASHQFTTKGCFTISLKVKFDTLCSASVTKVDSVCTFLPPEIHFTATPLVSCPQKAVNFKDSIIGLNKPGDTIQWFFGDGGTSRIHNPGYQYNDTGSFTVKLRACNYGCCDTVKRINYIYIYPPIAIPNAPVRCDSPYIRYFDGSKSLGADHFFWHFGDPASGPNDSSHLSKLKHVYSKRGDYVGSLTVTNDSSHCKHTSGFLIHIVELHARFTYTPISACAPVVIKCINTSQDAIKVHWQVFYDETGKIIFESDSLKRLIDTVRLPGHYKVKMLATDINGCKDSIVHDTVVTVYGFSVNFTETPNSGCPPLTSTFTNTSSSTTSLALNYKWYFGDTSSHALDSSSLQNPTHIFRKTGCYTVTFKIYDNHGCTSKMTVPNVVCLIAPKGNFTSTTQNACAYSPVYFQASNISPGVVNYSWDFGDPASGTSNSSTITNPSHIYRSSGKYTVKLHISTSLGCDTIITKNNFVIITKPHANFGTPDSTHAVCPPLTVRFRDSSYSRLSKWVWTFGDSGTSSLRNPSHIYTKSGVFDVSLIVKDSSGCLDTLVKKKYIVINGPTGTVTFTPNKGCAPLRVTFYAHSANAKYFVWDYGNTTSGKIPNADTISYIYTVPGVYHPKVILDNGFGCTRSLVSPDSVVVTGFSADRTHTPRDVCPGSIVHFKDTLVAGASILSQYWDFGDPTSGTADTSTLSKTTHVFSASGTYYIHVRISSAYCHDTLLDTVSVHPNPNIQLRLLKGFCLGDTTRFYDSTNHPVAITYRHWNFGDVASLNNSSTIKNPTHKYPSSGFYVVTLTLGDIYGCKDSLQKPVDIYTLPVVKKNNDTTVCFKKPIQLIAGGGVKYKWTPNTYLSSDSIANPVAKPLSNITYQIAVTDVNSCHNAAQIIVTVKPLPTIKARPDTTVCSNDTIHFLAHGAKNYTWVPSTYLSSTIVENPVCIPGVSINYIVTGTDSNGCSNTDSLAISVNPLPNVSTKPDTGVCIGAKAYLHARGANTYKWSPSAYLSSTTISNPVATPTSTTTFYVTGKDTHGCVNTDSVIVTIYNLPTINKNPDTTVCIFSPVQLQASGGVKYKWTPNTYLNKDTVSNPVSRPRANIIYTVLVTDIHTCQNTAVVKIATNPLPKVKASPDTLICANDTIQFIAKGANTYKWLPNKYLNNSNISNPICIPKGNLKYIVTGTDLNGCTNKDTVLVKVHFLPVLNAKPDTGVCLGASAHLHVTGALKYIWSPATYLSSTTISNPISTPTKTIRYSIIGIDSNKCRNYDSVLVTVYPLPVIKLTNDTLVCPFVNVQLNASGGVKYKWAPATYLNNDSVATPVSSPSSTIKSITYSVLVTDIHTCQNVANVKIALRPIPPVKATSPVIACLHDSVQLNVKGAKTYTWTPATYLSSTTGSNPISRPLTDITYIVKGVDSSNCFNIDSVHIRVDSLPKFVVTPDTSVCIGMSVQLVIHGLKNNTYVWSPSTYLSSTTIYNPISTPTATIIYNVIATDSNSCKKNDSFKVTVYKLPVVGAGVDTTVCAKQPIPLYAAPGFVSYLWAPPTYLDNNTIRTPISTPDTSIIYTVTITDTHGCINSQNINITTRPLPNIKAYPDTAVCTGKPVDLFVTGAIKYVWAPPTYLSDTSISNPVSHPKSNIVYFVKGTDSHGCVNGDSLHLAIYNLPTVTAGPDSTICFGSSLTLYATGGVSYIWSPAAYLSNSAIANPLATPPDTMIFRVSVTDVHGCINYDSVLINVIQKIKKTLSKRDTLCFGKSVQLFASGGVYYTWTPNYAINQTNIPNPVVMPGTTTRYIVTIYDGHCFSDTGSILVKVNPIPVLNIGPRAYSVVVGDAVMIGAYNVTRGTYSWTPVDYLSAPDSSQTLASPRSKTTYVLTLKDLNGCQTTDSVTVDVLCKDAHIFIPDAFAPGDSKYPVFKINHVFIKQLVFLRIFDRWGNLLFETSELDGTWDGRYKGQLVDPGVYVYYLKAICTSEEPIFRKGNITVIR